MTGQDISDEDLVALADGELPDAQAAALREKIAADPALAEAFAMFVETRALLAPHGVPARDGDDAAGLARLAAGVRAADAARRVGAAPQRPFAVIDGGAPAAASPPMRPAAPPAPRFRLALPAMAASVALVLGGVAGFVVGRGGAENAPGGGVVAAAGSPAAAAAAAAALERSPSGEKLGWSDTGSNRKGVVAVVATHRLKGGAFCREYEVSVDGLDGAAVGLGCRESGGTWRTEVLARAASPGADYGVASGANVVESALDSLGAEGAMPAADEKALLGFGWTERSTTR